MNDATITAIIAESERAQRKYGVPQSTHESLGVLTEEFDELREAIRHNDANAIIAEAIQVASVAHRLALVCSRGYASFLERSGLG